MNTLVRLASVLILASTSLFAQSQSEMNEEAARDAVRADKELNRAYKQVLDSLDVEAGKLLRDSQRAWIAYRDAEAKSAADEARGGSMAPLLYSSALANLTDERVKRLRQRLGDAEAPGGITHGPRSTEQGKQPASGTSEGRPEREPEAPSAKTGGASGAKTQSEAARGFFEAFKAHDREAAQKVAAGAALDKLVWDSASGDNSTLKLMDATHIYYEGGSIQLKMQKTKSGRWIVSDVGVTAD